jgi:thymidylate synthase ThyX
MEKSLRHTKPETATGMTQEYFNNYLIMYEQLLNNGITKEDARQVLPLGTLTHFCVSGNLRSWLHFLDERQSSHAQKEIRELADSVAAFLMNYFPLTYLTWQRAKLKSCGLKDINGVELFEFDEISWHDNVTKNESLGVLLYEKYDGVLTWIVKFYNDQSKVPLILVKKTMHSPEVLRG